jgi:hypothetical protein
VALAANHNQTETTMAKTKKRQPKTPDELDLKQLRDIEAAELQCQESEGIVLEAREHLKQAKELHAGHQFQLRRLARARLNDEHRPLFNQKPEKKKRGKRRAAPSPDGAALIGAPPGFQPEGDAWQAVPLSELKVSGTILTALLAAKLETMGGLCEYCRSGKKLLDIDGITLPEAAKLEQALAKFWGGIQTATAAEVQA